MRIKKGAKGNAVADIQQRLAGLGYELGATGVDGYFEGWTVKAVESFQRDRNLEVTGVVDEQTWRRMVDATYKLGDRALYLRSPLFHGDDVRQLQMWLNSIGFRTDQTDGIFGSSTERAVKEFQENLDLSMDGIVGPSTLAVLHNIRGVLNNNHSPLLIDGPSTDSVVSLLSGRTIAVGCLTPHKRQWLAVAGNNQLLCADLSHRLSNLLEILGAQANFFKLQPQPRISGDVVIAFRPGGPDVPSDCVGVRFDSQDGNSRKLAELISGALQNSLKQRVGEIVLSEGPGYGKPAVEISPGILSYLAENDNVKADVFKQKIAGAVFDALKTFFELHQSNTD